MARRLSFLLATVAYTYCCLANAQNVWAQGKSYSVIAPAQPTTVPAGKIEAMEVFSYGRIACNQFQPIVDELKRHLSSSAQKAFLPASFNKNEDWPMFQRAYFEAQHLGIAEQTHQAIFDAVWKTGELAIVDPSANLLKLHQPTLEDAARCYARISASSPSGRAITNPILSLDRPT